MIHAEMFPGDVDLAGQVYRRRTAHILHHRGGVERIPNRETMRAMPLARKV